MRQFQTQPEGTCPMTAGRRQATQSPGHEGRAVDWIQTQSRILEVWLDRLIAEGDPDDLITMLHRQKAWLEMMQARLAGEGDPADATR